MAKSRSRSRSRSSGSRFSQAWRDHEFTIARTPLPRRILTPLSVVEDFRRYHPHASRRHLRDLRGSIILPRSRIGFYTRSLARRRSRSDARRLRRVAFDVTRTLPRHAVICARRHSREEVLFALGRAGRRGQRRPRFNENSSIHCRR